MDKPVNDETITEFMEGVDHPGITEIKANGKQLRAILDEAQALAEHPFVQGFVQRFDRVVSHVVKQEKNRNDFFYAADLIRGDKRAEMHRAEMEVAHVAVTAVRDIYSGFMQLITAAIAKVE